MRDVDREGVMLGWGVEGIQYTLCFPLYFAINLKSLKKKTNSKSIHKQQHWRSVQKEPEGPGTATVTGAEGRRGWAAGDSRLLFPTPQQQLQQS